MKIVSLPHRSASWRNLLLSLMAAFLLILGCRKDVAIPDSSDTPPIDDISFKIPEGWPVPFYNFQNNKLTAAGFALGRKIFYDVRLSKDNSTSCGTCHQSFAAFANSGHMLSHGVNGTLGTRNSPALFNLNWHTSFMWDGGVNHIEIQPLAPITNPVEMDETVTGIITKLSNDPAYAPLFQKAYGSADISSERIFKALAQFMGAMVSDNSKYDQYKRGQTGVSLSTAEMAGLTVYEQKCAACHKAPLFTDFSFRNIGLQPSALNDSGRTHITRDPANLYQFKVPTLRNLAYSAPYMHDGRFTTLEQVLNQMDKEVYDSPTLDPLLKGGIRLTDQEKSDLLAFLNTLNDETFVKDKRFEEPL